MSQIKLNKKEKNKQVVLEAFDTLFNQRDYIAAERYWSPMEFPSHLCREYLRIFKINSRTYFYLISSATQ
jgi:hypothetical protein